MQDFLKKRKPNKNNIAEKQIGERKRDEYI